MEKNSTIYVAGHRGMVGSAIVRYLKSNGYTNIITRTSKQLDLTIQEDVLDFFSGYKPKYVILAAAKVGGILSNSTYRGDFIYNNLMIQSNVIESSHIHGVEKLLFLGSSCIYPKFAKQPISEDSLLTGALESSNRSYAIAKIAGIEMCDAYRAQYGCNFISAMPTNLYGPNDNYDLETSHVLPALIRKFHEAKVNGDTEVILWGTGTPLREFMHVDDMAAACIFLMDNYDEPGPINIGTGFDLTIRGLASIIKGIVGFKGDIDYDDSKPDGTPRKNLNVSKLRTLGFEYSIQIIEGITSTYQDFKKQYKK
jgi:GDP-L-fucose synthase